MSYRTAENGLPIDFTPAVKRLCGNQNFRLLEKKGLLPMAVAIFGLDLTYPPRVRQVFSEPAVPQPQPGLKRLLWKISHLPELERKKTIIETEQFQSELLLCFARLYGTNNTTPVAALREAALVCEPLDVGTAFALINRPEDFYDRFIYDLYYYFNIGLVTVTNERRLADKKIILNPLVRLAFAEEDKLDWSDTSFNIRHPMAQAYFRVEQLLKSKQLSLVDYWDSRIEIEFNPR